MPELEMPSSEVLALSHELPKTPFMAEILRELDKSVKCIKSLGILYLKPTSQAENDLKNFLSGVKNIALINDRELNASLLLALKNVAAFFTKMSGHCVGRNGEEGYKKALFTDGIITINRSLEDCPRLTPADSKTLLTLLGARLQRTACGREIGFVAI